MGCGQSKEPAKDTGRIIANPSHNSGLSEQELLKRLDAPKENQIVNHCGLNLTYAWVSKRGYYPDSLDKPNQDSYSVIPKFGEDPKMAFFGVYDGHGKEGHCCAWYVRDNLPRAILANLKGCSDNPKNIKRALIKAHIDTNHQMHDCPDIDDSLSGTTSITILMKGGMIYVSNVGDSRAIILSDSQSSVQLFANSTAPPKLVAKPLSADQTPYRKDERERVKKCGARVLSMDQIDKVEPVHENWGDLTLGENIDEGGDPPRVWSPLGDYPGTAFTRSFGDAIAEELGVYAEPEILSRKLVNSDKFLVIASDGVFEFLTNQMVADLIAQHVDDPLQACKIIGSQAYDLWLQYEVRTDDITIIIIKLTGLLEDIEPEEIPDHSIRPVNHMDINVNLAGENRPVRRALSKEKKKAVIVNSNQEEDEVFDLQSLVVAKSSEETAAIADALKTNFLFQHLVTNQRSTVISVMQPITVNPGDVVIKQGDQGDRFYIIDSGRYEVRVQGPALDDPTGGNVVHVYESAKDFHPGFGELSLMYGKPRAATVIALTPGRLWALDRRVFRSVVMKAGNSQRRKEIILSLQKVELFQCLTFQQFQRLADLLNESTFQEGDYIIRQGEIGDNFYLITNGRCDCTKSLDTGGELFLVQRKENEYFGERALLSSEPRAANVKAATLVKVLFIGKAAFDEVLGSLADLINEDRIRREALANAVNLSSQKLEGVVLSGLVTVDNLGPISMGSFGAASSSSSPTKQGLTIRSFILSDVDKNNMSLSALQFVEAIKSISVLSTTASPGQKNTGVAFLPRLTTISRDTNAIHLLFDESVVADLSSLIKSASKEASHACDADTYVFVSACVVIALEALHGIGIIYRAIQPEGLYISATGKIVLMDFRVCKVGGVRDRTYTICGATDYLAPEQISQVGHSAPVDFWALGVMMYELVTGTHPFSLAGEVATYSKIASYGSKAFPELPFSEHVNLKAKNLINKLVVATPEARLGVSGGFVAIKKNPFFENVDWFRLNAPGVSPLRQLAVDAYDELVKDGVSSSLIESFSMPYTSTGWETGIRL